MGAFTQCCELWFWGFVGSATKSREGEHECQETHAILCLLPGLGGRVQLVLI